MKGRTRAIARRLLLRLGYRVTRAGPTNRFDAAEDALALLRRLGYRPQLIIDAGANVGNWTAMAQRVFPEARCHLVEPQPRCVQVLRAMAETRPTITVHAVAVTKPGVKRVRLVGGGTGGEGTGARVAGSADSSCSDEFECDATTLDALLANVITDDDRVLLKLDLQGHELEALKGATGLLSKVEVVFCEVAFFDFWNLGRPVFSDVLGYLAEFGFVLYDVAALAPRRRDQRLRMGDVVVVRKESPLMSDCSFV
ncbi:MAG TPA: FkbM family methyltransferase [Thermoanaerobaculaceae bacterium]|nr:FkbM family methyltransferase [Thermoanaerobaculaceae bacterium]